MKYAIKTFGCQMNENDSKIIASLLEQAGYCQATDVADADIMIVNTCCVRESAENKIDGFIGNLKHWKTADKVLVICGCMSQKDGTAIALKHKFPFINILIGTFALTKLPGYLDQVLQEKKFIIDIEENYELNPEVNADFLPTYNSHSFLGQVNIMYGCNNFCSYCIVPYVRGKERSRQPEAILREVEYLVSQGCVEVMLLGQNVNSYGNDLEPGWNFARLLTAVNEITGLKRIRYITSHPKDFSRELIDTIVQLDKVCTHFHLPIQSGCNKILQAMNRKYTVEEYTDILSYLRTQCPQAAVTTDLIIGFPGETEEDFDATLDFIRKARFDVAYTFLYSQRSGTPAATMENQISAQIKKQRFSQLIQIQNQISLEINQSLVGQTLDVLVEGFSKNNNTMLTGRTSSNKIAVFPLPNLSTTTATVTADKLRGKIVSVRISAVNTWTLTGEIV